MMPTATTSPSPTQTPTRQGCEKANKKLPTFDTWVEVERERERERGGEGGGEGKRRGEGERQGRECVVARRGAGSPLLTAEAKLPRGPADELVTDERPPKIPS